MKQFKQWLPDVLAVFFFAILAFVYFYPADVEDRVLNQGDIAAGIGMAHEKNIFYEQTGEVTRWTNALFSGMPTYQISPTYNSSNTLSAIEKAYHLWLPDNVWYLFVYLLGFYILLRAFDFRQHLAALGAVAWAFSTYFLIIIAAGHLWKVMALAYLPPMIAGIVLAYSRGKYLWGLVVTAFFGALEVHANHVQMTYYYLLVIFFMVLAFMIEALRKKQYTHILKATVAVVAGGLLAVLVNSSNLYHTWQYSKETMRGKSELVRQADGDGQQQTTSGLTRSYITDYSYGIGETWTLLVPNAKGGTSMKLLLDDEGARNAISDITINVGEGQMMKAPQVFDYLMQNGLYFTQYWEENMEEGANGTMGPVYVGALVMMLFVLCLLICYKKPLTWGLLAATLLSIMLAWGKNFMGLTDFFIDYIPMYAKFRAVESILVVAEFTIPLMAMMAVHELWRTMENGTPEQKGYVKKATLGAFLLTGGIVLFFGAMPTTFFDFYTNAEANLFRQILPPPADANALLEALSKARQAVFTADCWRSLVVIVLGALVLVLYNVRKLKAMPMVLILLAICIADLWPVNKRYLNDEQFKPRSEMTPIRALTDADREILKDTSLDYRVMNLAGNFFNENETSYYHKSVGGYHAAKLRRYQDLADAYLFNMQKPDADLERKHVLENVNLLAQKPDSVPGDSLWPVLNMLNTKYFLSAQHNIAVRNPYALGNAWMVDEVKYVDSANDELDGLGQNNLRHVAVADRQFQEVLGEAAAQDSTTLVEMTSYEPNELKYHVSSEAGGVVVFSEIYFPGWEAAVDGEEATLGRVDYVLRALRVTPGEHDVVLTFKPKSISTTETLAYVAMAVLALLVILLLVGMVRKK